MHDQMRVFLYSSVITRSVAGEIQEIERHVLESVPVAKNQLIDI